MKTLSANMNMDGVRIACDGGHRVVTASMSHLILMVITCRALHVKGPWSCKQVKRVPHCAVRDSYKMHN